MVERMTNILDNKADRSDFNLLINSMNNKAEKSEIENMTDKYI